MEVANFEMDDKMEGEQEYNENMCRLCDKTSDQMYGVFEKSEGGKQIIQMIKEVLPIVIYRSDPLPKQICDLCYENLETSHQLRMTALETLALQKERLKNDLSDDGAELYLQTVENGDVKENGFPESQDASTETTGESTQASAFCKNCKAKLKEDEMICELQNAITESMRKSKEDSRQMNGALSHLDKNENNLDSDMEICETDREILQITAAPKRILEESPCLGPTIKRRKIGPKSRTKPRNIMERVHYEPLSLMQTVLNQINKDNMPDYEYETCEKIVDYEVEPVCLHCDEIFPNVKLLALHESQEHIQVNLFDRVDDEVLWNKSRVDANVRNRWLEENLDGSEAAYPDYYEDDEDNEDNQNLLVPIEPVLEEDGYEGEGIVLVDCKPYVNGIPLADLRKEDRRALYKSIMVAGVKRKFCNLCRFTFKDNWAIELHYFTSACYYTCRYCGVRFNKQRQVFDEHVEDHIRSGHSPTTRIFAARKKNDPIPKVVHISTIKREDEEDEEWKPKPKVVKPIKMRNLFQKSGFPNSNSYSPNSSNSYQSGFPSGLTIKREPGVTSDTEVDAQNQAYFCRKCYKVFFKLDEFNTHVTSCNGTGNTYKVERIKEMREQSPTDESEEREEPSSSRGSAYSSSGRPIRNCVKEVASYNDNFDLEVDSDSMSHSNSPISGYQCTMCSSIFPTVHSRNSHMRIHKSNIQSFHSIAQKSHGVYKNRQPPNLAKQVVKNIMNRQHEANNYNYNNFDNVYIKQEPMEPEVEIHESEAGPDVPTSIGNVSITPIPSASQKVKPLNPDIMRLVQNNPNITIRSMNNPNRSEASRNPTINHNNSINYSNSMASSSNYNHNKMVASAPQQEDNHKMYRCSSCSKPFSNKSNLYFHKKNQCGGSRYPCPFCKKRFGTEAAYSSHIFYSHPE